MTSLSAIVFSGIERIAVRERDAAGVRAEMSKSTVTGWHKPEGWVICTGISSIA